MNFENRNYAFSGAFVDELARCGLRHVCFCPGSRSTPLTLSFARHPEIKMWAHLDERSASFFALGMARALRQPVALVCSSGTAAANFFPAVIEAHESGVPLLVLTADRPPELIDWGALQTINQNQLYGEHVKWSIKMPVPQVTDDLMGFVRSTACRVYAVARNSTPGPVHVDFPFRDPLDPVEVESDFAEITENKTSISLNGRANKQPFIREALSEHVLARSEIERLSGELKSTEKGLIVCGPQPDIELREVVIRLAQQLDYPILADPLSQVRFEGDNSEPIEEGDLLSDLMIDRYDAFLRDVKIAESLVPEVILRFGAVLASKPTTQFLEKHRDAHHILIGHDGGWRDPFRLTSDIVHTDPVWFCKELASVVPKRAKHSDWAKKWHDINVLSEEAINQQTRDLPATFLGCDLGTMFEGRVFHELASAFSRWRSGSLFVGNSMPIRDLDTFFPKSGIKNERVRFFANRGVSGIDGVVSTALGVSAITEDYLHPTVLVIGDISFYHDMNGLLAAKKHKLNATIIVINNDGGGIFSFLPQAAYKDSFETYFGTPHGLTFRAVADLYDLGYNWVKDWSEFHEALQKSVVSGGTNIIEIPGNRATNVDLHRMIWEGVTEKIHSSLDV